MCDLNDRTKIYPVVTVFSTIAPPGMTQEKVNQILLGGEVPAGIRRWRRDMRITIILTSNTLMDPGRVGVQDPLVAQTFANYPDMQERFSRFAAGDWSALSQPGIVLLNLIVTASKGWYK
jgi:hypothetical protein